MRLRQKAMVMTYIDLVIGRVHIQHDHQTKLSSGTLKRSWENGAFVDTSTRSQRSCSSTRTAHGDNGYIVYASNHTKRIT